MKRSIRAATRADVGAMLEIYGPIVDTTAISFETVPPDEETFAERVARVQERDPWLVSEVGDRVVGYAYAAHFRARPAYAATRETTVYVHPEAHGRGVGRQLMEALLTELSAAGCRMAIAGIVLPNPSSIALHESLGFSPVGTFHQVGHKLGRWHDLGFWELDLGDRPLSVG